MDDIRYFDGKLYSGASWYQLSMIEEVTVEKRVAYWRAVQRLLCFAPFILRGASHWRDQSWYWIGLAMALAVAGIDLKARVFRVFASMDPGGRYEVAKILGGGYRFFGPKVSQAEEKARKLAEEIRAKIPDRA